MGNVITVTHEVSDEFVMDVLTNAIESGCLNYWASLGNIIRDSNLNVTEFQVADAEAINEDWNDMINDGVSQKEAWDKIENDGDIWTVIDKDAILKGIQKALGSDANLADYIVGYIRRSVADDDAGDMDAEACDAVVQFAAFDEVVFG